VYDPATAITEVDDLLKSEPTTKAGNLNNSVTDGLKFGSTLSIDPIALDIFASKSRGKFTIPSTICRDIPALSCAVHGNVPTANS
jgi:hypothetical protein